MSVRLNDFYTYPSDVDMMLVGPGGQAIAFMSDLGGSAAATGLSISFSDTAPSLPPGTLVSGIYRPSNIGAGDVFPGPAPASYQSPSPAALATFANTFGGTDPNGTREPLCRRRCAARRRQRLRGAVPVPGAEREQRGPDDAVSADASGRRGRERRGGAGLGGCARCDVL